VPIGVNRIAFAKKYLRCEGKLNILDTIPATTISVTSKEHREVSFEIKSVQTRTKCVYVKVPTNFCGSLSAWLDLKPVG
jgi:hypothetical protein